MKKGVVKRMDGYLIFNWFKYVSSTQVHEGGVYSYILIHNVDKHFEGNKSFVESHVYIIKVFRKILIIKINLKLSSKRLYSDQMI